MTSTTQSETSKPASFLRPWSWPLHWQIFLGLGLGAALGLWLGQLAIERIAEDVAPDQRGAAGASIVKGTLAYQLCELAGDLFLAGLKLIIVPLVFSSIVLAIANIARTGGFGRLGLKTLTYYLTTSLLAVLVGLALVNTFTPGTTDSADGTFSGAGILVGQNLDAFASEAAAVTDKVGGKTGSDFLNVFRAMVPENFFDAAADNGQLLGLITVAMFVGFFLSRLPDDPGNDTQKTLHRFFDGVYRLTLMITDVVLKLAPLGVLFLLAATVALQWAKLRPDGRFDELITGVTKFAVVAVSALAIHFLVAMPLILVFVARVNPLRHYRAMAPALMTAFSTASSSATLPLTLDCVQDRAGVSRKVGSFTLPLGATVNMDGTALYECVAAMFICQAFGLELSFAQQFMIVVIALLTSVGVAGVPSASLVAIAVILQAVEQQLPPGSLPGGATLLSGMALLFVFDRPLDMCRTAVNVFGDSVGAVTVARSEGETGILKKP
ncbi:MAG: dicarboxylate/amino acid:cation symporter [Planctomycetota bacterium]